MTFTLRPDLAVVLRSRLPYDIEVLTDRPSMYHRVGGASGNPRDLAGTNDVTVVGGTPTYSQAGALLGDPDMAVSFNGVDQYFQVPDFAAASIATTGILTVEFWDKPAVGQEGCPVAKTQLTPSSQYEWAIYADTGSLYYTQVWTLASAGIATSLQTGTVTFGIWHHVVVVFDEPNDTIRWYIDGTLNRVDTTIWSAATADGTAPVSIGQRGDGSAGLFHEGPIDEVAIYNYALSAERVRAHYQAAGY